ncbi:MAG: hypothetical protein ABI629_21580, partial [bacterium]
MQHLQQVSACDARAKETVLLNLAHVGDLVADRRNLADRSLESLLRVLCPAKAATCLLPNIPREQQRWQLT